MLEAAKANRIAKGNNMFNPEVTVKHVKIGNSPDASGNISQIPTKQGNGNTRITRHFHHMTPNNHAAAATVGLLPRPGGVGYYPALDKAIAAENRANTAKTKNASSSNGILGGIFAPGDMYLKGPRDKRLVRNHKRVILNEMNDIAKVRRGNVLTQSNKEDRDARWEDSRETRWLAERQAIDAHLLGLEIEGKQQKQQELEKQEREKQQKLGTAKGGYSRKHKTQKRNRKTRRR
jgi:hypothetical protein